jgi:hypothetical protein
MAGANLMGWEGIEDLKHNPETNPLPVDAQRAFTIAQLVIFRARDSKFAKHRSEYDLLSEIANSIYEIALTWKDGKP